MMEKKVNTYTKYAVLVIGIVVALLRLALQPGSGQAQAAPGSNIDPSDKWAWSANAGWIDFNPTHGGVTVYADHLEGYAWAENVGWIRLGTHTGGGAHSYANTADNYGVNNDGSGNLSGYAWSANAGWIDFNPTYGGVTIDPTSGSFEGYAWSENVGWIHFKGDTYNVVTDWRHCTVYLPLVLRNHSVAPDLVVERIVATSDDVQVVIANHGNAPAGDDFWVDVYLDPAPAPTHVNQVWNDLSAQGLVWGVTADLAPGEALTLTVGGDHYVAAYSHVAWPLPAGTQVYAQVDSANAETTYGAVLESHEVSGGAYNNVAGPVGSTGVASGTRPPSPAGDGGFVEDGALPSRP
jgi:hypothetical protein